MAKGNLNNLDPDFAARLQRLLEASKGAVWVSSGYRSPERQAQLFSAAVKKYGSEKAARKWVAPPGRSNHNRGMAADLAGNLTLAQQLAPQFGLNFPMGHEKWHIELPKARKTSMAQTKKTPPTASRPQSLPSAGLMNAFTPNGVDLAALIASLQMPQSQPMPLFDPNAPRTMPNPGYNPVDFQSQPAMPADYLSFGQSMPFSGPTRPVDTRKTLTLPSYNETRNSAEKKTTEQAPTQTDSQIAQLKSQANLLKALADWQETNPTPQREMPEDPAYPNRQSLPIPQRGNAEVGMLPAILAAIAGIADPQGAGGYTASVFQGAMQGVDQQYNDEMQRWQMATDQLTRQYEDELARRNDLIRLRREKGEVAYQNAVNEYNRRQKAAENKAQMGANTDLLTALMGIGQQEKASNLSALEARQTDRTISEGLQGNTALLNADKNASTAENNLLKTILGFGGNVFKAQTQAQTSRANNTATNETRKSVAEQNNATRVTTTAMNNATSKRNTDVRVQAAREVAKIRTATPAQAKNSQEVAVADRLLRQAATNRERIRYQLDGAKIGGKGRKEDVAQIEERLRNANNDVAMRQRELDRALAKKDKPAPVMQGGKKLPVFDLETGKQIR